MGDVFGVLLGTLVGNMDGIEVGFKDVIGLYVGTLVVIGLFVGVSEGFGDG